MYLEEKIELLSNQVQELKQTVEILQDRGAEHFVSVKELARIMGCSENTIYIKIREGLIVATKKTGEHRIPMSQFYPDQSPVEIIKLTGRTRRKKRLSEKEAMKEIIFGNGD